jgi:hypothetical protein
VFPGKHQFISCRNLIFGWDFINVHDSKQWHILSSFLFLFFGACCAHSALACQEKQGGLDRTVEAMCQNGTKNNQRCATGKLTGKKQYV